MSSRDAQVATTGHTRTQCVEGSTPSRSIPGTLIPKGSTVADTTAALKRMAIAGRSAADWARRLTRLMRRGPTWEAIELDAVEWEFPEWDPPDGRFITAREREQLRRRV